MLLDWKKVINMYKLFNRTLLIIIILSLICLFVLIIHKPKRVSKSYIVNTGKELKSKDVIFPLHQKIKFSSSEIINIIVYYGDDSINNFHYKVKLLNKQMEVLRNFNLNQYGSNILIIPVMGLNLKKGDEVTLKFTCDECYNVKMVTGKPMDNNTVIKNTNDSLNIIVEYYVVNKGYYWYLCTFIIVSLILLPLTMEKEYE